MLPCDQVRQLLVLVEASVFMLERGPAHRVAALSCQPVQDRALAARFLLYLG
jgi:hypothetical protein